MDRFAIKNLRKGLCMTQTEFSKMMGVSLHTVRSWEQGKRNPLGPALRLMEVYAHRQKVIEGIKLKVNRLR